MRDYGHYIDTELVKGPDDVLVGAGLSGTMVLVYGGNDIVHEDEGPAIPPKFILEEDSSLNVCIVVLPGVDKDITISADLAGPGANLSLSGIYVCAGNERVSFRTEVLHRSGNCISDQVVNGIASGSSKVGFFGRIIVAPDAQKTEAFQTNRNIVLSREAKVDTRPQLEIYADDVKCSHGATVGSLNEDEQFYMRSRGIPEQEAKVLQMLSFLSPVLEKIPDEESREILRDRIEKAVRSLI